MWITTRSKTTGLYASYPEHFLALFPDLEEVAEEEPCTDCGFQGFHEPEKTPTPATVEVQLKEPTPQKRTKK